MSSSQQSNRIEVADIFREFGPLYRQIHKLPSYILKTMKDIESCRTAALGGHVDECDRCGHVMISYNSCRNRHCPKCQNLAKERWIQERKRDLLPVPYFHLVFTLPDTLNPLALVNPKAMYDLLFKSASEALLELGQDPEHLGAQVGMIAILHTWGQNLLDHLHLHGIVPGGGLSKDGQAWISSREDFFIHVMALSRSLRGKFLFYLKKAYRAGSLKCVGKAQHLGDPKAFQILVDQLYELEWVVYSKRPFGGPEQVLEYLGRYTHRVAISNNRIVKWEDGRVTFRWRDYRDGDQVKLMTLDALEFIRRFLLHILPQGFFKIRYYGILGSRNRHTKLKRCKELLGVAIDQDSPGSQPESWEELLFELTGLDPRICPKCQEGRMVTRELLRPAVAVHAPP